MSIATNNATTQYTMDVVVLTDERYATEEAAAEETELERMVRRNVLEEDGLVLTALAARGLKVQKVAWSDPNFDWKTTKYALFRST